MGNYYKLQDSPYDKPTYKRTNYYFPLWNDWHYYDSEKTKKSVLHFNSLNGSFVPDQFRDHKRMWRVSMQNILQAILMNIDKYHDYCEDCKCQSFTLFELQFEHYPKTSMEQLRNSECDQSKVPYGQKCSTGWDYLTDEGWVHDQNLKFQHQGTHQI